MKWPLFQVGKLRPGEAKSLAQSRIAGKDGAGMETLIVMHLLIWGKKKRLGTLEHCIRKHMGEFIFCFILFTSGP